MRIILSLLLENQPGSLSRVVGLFSQRGYNIESLTVSPTDDDTLSRINITTDSDHMQLEQIQKNLHKLVDVLKIQDVTESAHIERELMLVKLKANEKSRDEVYRLAEIFRGQVVDVSPSIYTIQLTGESDKLDAFLTTVASATQIIEVARSGVVGIARGERALKA